jgi:ectoine hydroxylase-related dioxygenase (phytanoyl-CoA dioxygenase family)
VQPPAVVLEGMLTVRLHLDACAGENGALRVVPGSHARGRLSPEEIAALASSGEAVLCEAPAGGLLVMRPLLVHASSAATRPGRRRVLHLDFAREALPAPLRWRMSARIATA